MDSWPVIARAGACACLAVSLVAASLPSAMTGPGLWEVSRSARGSGAQRICLKDPAMLMQWEHRARQCTRTVVRSALDRAEVDYSCAGGDFGRSQVTVLTPRSVRIASQGILNKYPFSTQIHARRIGNCPAR